MVEDFGIQSYIKFLELGLDHGQIDYLIDVCKQRIESNYTRLSANKYDLFRLQQFKSKLLTSVDVDFITELEFRNNITYTLVSNSITDKDDSDNSTDLAIEDRPIDNTEEVVINYYESDKVQEYFNYKSYLEENNLLLQINSSKDIDPKEIVKVESLPLIIRHIQVLQLVKYFMKEKEVLSDIVEKDIKKASPLVEKFNDWLAIFSEYGDLNITKPKDNYIDSHLVEKRDANNRIESALNTFKKNNDIKYSYFKNAYK